MMHVIFIVQGWSAVMDSRKEAAVKLDRVHTSIYFNRSLLQASEGLTMAVKREAFNALCQHAQVCCTSSIPGLWVLWSRQDLIDLGW